MLSAVEASLLLWVALRFNTSDIVRGREVAQPNQMRGMPLCRHLCLGPTGLAAVRHVMLGYRSREIATRPFPLLAADIPTETG